MGKQVNFYMTESDEAAFLEFVRSDRDVCIIPYRLNSDDMKCVATLPKENESFGYMVSLWDRDHSPQPLLKHISQQGYWVVDRLNCEVIEYARSTLSEAHLVRGRIWAGMTALQQTDPPSLVRKSKIFEQWYDRLARWIKKNSWRDNNGDYVFPGAAEYERQGGKLVQAVFAKSVKEFHHDV